MKVRFIWGVFMALVILTGVTAERLFTQRHLPSLYAFFISLVLVILCGMLLRNASQSRSDGSSTGSPNGTQSH